MPDYKLKITGTFNNKQLVKALRQAGVDVDKLGKKTKKTGEDIGRFRSATSGLRRTIGAVRNNLLLLSFAFGATGAAIGKTVKDFAKFEKVKLGFDELGKKINFSSDALIKLKNATNNSVTSMELMKQANNAMLLGIAQSEDQMADMFDIAQRLASAVGQDAAFGIESLTTGIGRQSRLMLDNLGIIVKTEDAYKNYAKQINKSVSSLTEQERKTAFITAAMTAAREKVESLGEEQKTVSMILSETSSSIGELSIALGSIFSPAVVAVAQKITDWANSLRALVTEYKLLKGVEVDELEMLELIDEKNIQLNQTRKDLEEANKKSTWRRDQTTETIYLVSWVKQLSFEAANLTQQYLDMIEPGESVATTQHAISEAFGESFARLDDLMPGLALAIKLYNTTNEGQIALLETQLAIIANDIIILQDKENEEANVKKLIAVYADLEEKMSNLLGLGKEKLSDEEKTQLALAKKNKLEQEVMKTATLSAMKQGAAYHIIGDAARDAALNVIMAKTQEAIANYIADAFAKFGLFGAIVAASSGAVVGSVMQQASNVVRGAEGGLDEVITKPTLILAGEGNKAESVQITPLEGPNIDGPQMNSSITVNVSGNVLTQDFVEDELAGAIRDAARRGTDFGIS